MGGHLGPRRYPQQLDHIPARTIHHPRLGERTTLAPGQRIEAADDVITQRLRQRRRAIGNLVRRIRFGFRRGTRLALCTRASFDARKQRINATCVHGLGLDLVQQSAAQAFQPCLGAAATRAKGQMRGDQQGHRLRQAAGRMIEQQIVREVVDRHHGVSSIVLRSLDKARRIRDFTVPSGKPSCSAIAL